MHKYKARVKLDAKGKPVAAFPVDYACRGDEISQDWKGETEGYILTSLKKATSRNKGNELERDTAKIFSQWLYGRTDILARTPLSGGWEGSKLGDITANPAKLLELKLQMPKLYVECKNREGLLSETFFNWLSTGSPKTITEWIVDTVKKAGLQPWFLVLKGRATEPWVLTPWKCDPESFHFAFRGDNQTLYCLFPLKDIAAVYTYSKVKQEILCQ